MWKYLVLLFILNVLIVSAAKHKKKITTTTETYFNCTSTETSTTIDITTNVPKNSTSGIALQSTDKTTTSDFLNNCGNEMEECNDKNIEMSTKPTTTEKTKTTEKSTTEASENFCYDEKDTEDCDVDDKTTTEKVQETTVTTTKSTDAPNTSTDSSDNNYCYDEKENNTTCDISEETTTEQRTTMSSTDCGDVEYECYKTLETTATEKVLTTTEVPKNCNDASARIRRALYKLSAKKLGAIKKSNPRKTVVTSALPDITLIGVLKLYATGRTDKELSRILNVSSDNEISCAFNKVVQDINAKPASTQLYITANLVVNDPYEFTNDLIEYTNEIGAKAYSENFTNADEAAEVINENLEQMTFGQNDFQAYSENFTNADEAAEVFNDNLEEMTIGQDDGVASPNLFSNDTEMAWIARSFIKVPFKYSPISIVTKKFSVTPCETVKIPFYLSRERYNYTKTSYAEILEIPLSGEMTLLLLKPLRKFDVDKILKTISKNTDSFLSDIKNLKPLVVTVYLPTVNITMTVDTKEIMEKQDIGTIIFDSNKARYQGLLVGNPHLAISVDILKISYISTSMGDNLPSTVPKEEEEIVYDLDSPFVWILIYKDVPYFIGEVANNNAVNNED